MLCIVDAAEDQVSTEAQSGSPCWRITPRANLADTVRFHSQDWCCLFR